MATLFVATVRVEGTFRARRGYTRFLVGSFDLHEPETTAQELTTYFTAMRVISDKTSAHQPKAAIHLIILVFLRVVTRSDGRCGDCMDVRALENGSLAVASNGLYHEINPTGLECHDC